MHTQADQVQKKNRSAAANNTTQKKAQAQAHFVDNRADSVVQNQLQASVNQSTVSQKATQLQTAADAQSNNHLLQRQQNKTGLPDNLKSGIETLSGISMDDVKVHRNSSKPAQLQAHAYAQGSDIHLAPGQEKHLPHEAWHVVQQKQGRVKPTMQMKGKVNVNDDASLEKEADVMGAKALHTPSQGNAKLAQRKSISSPSVQRKEVDELITAIEAVMDAGKLKKGQITAGLTKLAKNDLDDKNFPRALVEFVKKRNEVNDFSITDLDQAPNPKFGKKHLNKKWTFRHYTNTKYDSLKSLASLEAAGINASANTNDRDWEELGNQGYVFGLICIDGQVPQRTWLSKMKYYAEYDLKDLSSIWVSGDMLDEEGRKKDSYQGSGKVIIAMLSKMLGFINQKEASEIDAKFANKLEGKVAPALLAKPDWKDA